MSTKAVASTNDSSTVSKASMARLGYFQDSIIASFVTKKARRSPLINRGYFIRVWTIDRIVRAFINAFPSHQKQVISMGAGFDTVALRMITQGYGLDTVFLELDLPEVVAAKSTLLSEFMATGDSLRPAKDFQSFNFTKGRYELASCDLRNLEKLQSIVLQHCDPVLPSLFLAECVFNYLKHEDSDAILSWIARDFSNAVFALYEQILPDDAFGRFMQLHFRKIGSPLRSIEVYPTLRDEYNRFKDLNWQHRKAVDLNWLYYNVLPDSQRRRINHLEPFDEYETWHLKCSHYVIALAANSVTGGGLLDEVFPASPAHAQLENFGSLTAFSDVQIASTSSDINRYGHCVSPIGADESLVVVTGGFGQTSTDGVGHRLINDLLLCELDKGPGRAVDVTSSFNVLASEIDLQRMHHTSTPFGKHSVLIFGGRRSPKRMPSNQAVIIELCDQTISLRPLLLQNDVMNNVMSRGRWRHTAVAVHKNGRCLVYILGGLTTSESGLIEALQDVISICPVTGALEQTTPLPIPLFAHSTNIWISCLVVVGGITCVESCEINGNIWCLDTTDKDNAWKIISTTPVARYSHRSHVYEDILIIVGGVGDFRSQSVRPDLEMINLITGASRRISVATFGPIDELWICFDSLLVRNNSSISVVVFGGGGNCFSFGTLLNKSVTSIELNVPSLLPL